MKTITGISTGVVIIKTSFFLFLVHYSQDLFLFLYNTCSDRIYCVVDGYRRSWLQKIVNVKNGLKVKVKLRGIFGYQYNLYFWDEYKFNVHRRDTVLEQYQS